MDIMHRLQQSTGIGTCTSAGTCTSTGDQDADYHLTTNGLVRFRDMIYVLNCSELKNIILREFYVKPYSGHPGYRKTLATVKKFYYWPDLKKEVVEFVDRCFDCQ